MVNKGRSQYVTCAFCGRRVPRDKAIRTTKRSFSYFDERVGLKHMGTYEKVWACPSCGRHRGIKDQKPRRGRPKKR